MDVRTSQRPPKEQYRQRSGLRHCDVLPALLKSHQESPQFRNFITQNGPERAFPCTWLRKYVAPFLWRACWQSGFVGFDRTNAMRSQTDDSAKATRLYGNLRYRGATR